MSDTVAPRARPLFSISGWLMLVVLFLPTLKVCGDPTAPIEFPPSYFFYVGSAIAAATALGVTRRGRQVGTIVLLALWMIAVDLIVCGFAFGGLGIVGLLAAPLVMLVLTVFAIVYLAHARLGERVVQIVLVFHSLLAFGWYLLLVADPEAMWGAHVGLVVTSTMLVSAIANLVTYERARAFERRARFVAPLPRARVVS